ncbi:MAG: dehydrogenase [Euryarchaeota archaeon]|nr:dehydrogenase [Euryarchaeota archaeon]
MPKVYNWQLGREMDYMYEGSRPKRQVAWVFDTNKCIACQTCTIACKNAWTSGRGQEYMFWNNVETKPRGGFPLAYDQKVLELLGPQEWDGETYRGKTIFEAKPSGERVLGYRPEDEDYAHPNIGEDEVADIVQQGVKMLIPHVPWMFYLPRICNHCTYPACLAACPRGSIYKREEDGIVLIDQDRCRGYRECVKGCPYKKPFFRTTTQVSEKCIACFPQIEKGFQTQCVQNCIGKIRINGFLSPPDESRPDNPLDFLVHEKKLGLPLYPQLGLEPNVYYIPPIHVPFEPLIQMFGPGVPHAVETYRNAKDDPEIVGLIQLFGSTDRIIERFAIKGDDAIGYDAEGKEVARTPLYEPQVVRDPFDPALGIPRLNIT